MLNDFIFCPYSIYLHNVYVNADEGLYHAKPQTQGRLFHKSIDEKVASHNKGELSSLPVLSEKYGLMGVMSEINNFYKYLEINILLLHL